VRRRYVLGVVLASWALGITAWAQDPAGPGTGVGGTGTPSLPGSEAQADDGGQDRTLGEDEAMVLNFERADIREVIHSLATALGISYTLDPRIEGTVTIRTTGRIPRRDLFPLFNQILRQNGVAAVPSDGVYQILPVAEAKTRAIIPGGARRAAALAEDRFVIEILQVRHVAAEEMQNILQPFLTPGGDVFAYPRANALVVTDLQSNVRRLRELAAAFDIDGFSNLHARVFQMKEADPEELANELLTLLAPYGVTATGEGEGGVYMVPLQRLNAIVIFAIDPAVFAEVDRWLAFLDIPPDKGSGRQTFVYNVENAKAADLAAVLTELFGGGGGPGTGGIPGRAGGGVPSGVGLFGASGATGGVGGRTGGTARRSARGGGSAGGAAGLGGATSAVGGAGGVQTGGVGGAASLGGGATGLGGAGRGRRSGLTGATGVVAGQPGAPGAPGGAAAGVSLPGGPQTTGPFQQAGPPPVFREEVRIVADEVTNSLIVLATRRDYQLILDVVRKIDVVPRQVLLEVMIVEINLNDTLQFGVAFALAEGQLNTAIPFGNQDTPIFKNRSGGVNRGAHSLGGLLGTATRTPRKGAFAVITDKENFNIFINALQQQTSVKLLSAPHIIAADNREAHILVGESIPILTSTASNVLTSGTAATINSVQYRDTGKILTVLPQVNSKGLVNLQVRQEVSSVGSQSFGQTNSPSFVTREAETTLVVQDGDTVLIGGIIDDELRGGRGGIPYLMQIPVLGHFFRDDTDDTLRRELIITITPYVIRDREEAAGVTEDFSERIPGLSRLRRAMQAKRLRSRRAGSDELPSRLPARRRGAEEDGGAPETPIDSGVDLPPELR